MVCSRRSRSAGPRAGGPAVTGPAVRPRRPAGHPHRRSGSASSLALNGDWAAAGGRSFDPAAETSAFGSGAGESDAFVRLRVVVRPAVGVIVAGAIRSARRRSLCAGLILESLLEGVVVDPGGVEGIATPPVRQREPGGGADIVAGDFGASVPGGQRDRGARGDEVAAHPVDLERRADGGDLTQGCVAQHDLGQQGAGGDDPFGKAVSDAEKRSAKPSGSAS